MKLGEFNTQTFSPRWSEPYIIVSSFLAVLLPSALLLMLPPFSYSGLSFTDALFTATSAISVTGLGVVDTGSHFTLAGKILLMLLMQIGGLGQMTLSCVLFYLFGLRLSLRQQSLAKEALGQEKHINIRQLVIKIVIFSMTAQMIGALLLCWRWVPQFGWFDGIFTALFHAVSAFNNAGFSLFSNNLVGYHGDTLVSLSLAALFIAGGLGFTVVSDIHETWRKNERGWLPKFNKLRLHSKIMLVGTPILLCSGTVLILLLEHNNPNTLANMPMYDQLLSAFFQSATTRTAGFNTINIGLMTEPGLLIMMLLMLIGAGPTSTGGGLKVSTFAVALLATRAFLRQQNFASAFNRTLPWPLVTKALAIMVISALVLTLAMFLLMLTERAPFYEIMFETISAFATVGLTSGLTANLSEPGKLILIVVMIIGRIGPLTLAYMLSKPKPSCLKYPEDSILTG
ncbi:TrkH family potassium uptake protein [Shewanella sp. NIFS-20-20]|uniref:TrkH family potassium uptake protein n=1 Tax=Shewanella sp. NIFS-20-20 TaxID=2853806 RepID=UPI001C46E6B5|nr:TrkH family potassium uptake protein [Shewanella sp. NIFS-20-20]MBV7316640.1 TrkH family potassium uptake protein [Shewanella sp. NIFS-20-20]